MGKRHDELREIADNLRLSDFDKVASLDGIGKEAQGPGMMGGGMPPPMPGGEMMPPGGGGMMPPPEMLPPPEMMPPIDTGAAPTGTEGGEAAKGMKEVALRALDLTQGAVDQILGSDSLSPEEKVNATAAALETSGGLDGIPPEEIAALAQTPPQ